MKINIIPTLIVLTMSVLLAYLFFIMSDAGEQMPKALAISGFASTVICLEFGFGLSFKKAGRQVNNFAVSLLFFFLFVVEHCCFAVWGTDISWLVVATGLLLVLYLLLIYSINKIKF